MKIEPRKPSDRGKTVRKENLDGRKSTVRYAAIHVGRGPRMQE